MGDKLFVNVQTFGVYESAIGTCVDIAIDGKRQFLWIEATK